MEKRTFYLISSRVRDNALAAVNEADPGAIISVSPPKRSLEQNAKLHAILTDLARSPLIWAGKRRTVDEWKMLAVSAHAVATKEAGEIIPGLEGEFVAIRESTAQMGVKRASSLIEYLIAFCAQNGVELRETRKGGFLSDPSLSDDPGDGPPPPTSLNHGPSNPRSARAGSMERA
jgi:hypothetical protein